MSAELNATSSQALTTSPNGRRRWRSVAAFECNVLPLVSSSMLAGARARLESLNVANGRALTQRGFTLEELAEVHAEGLAGHLSAERGPAWLSDRDGLIFSRNIFSFWRI